jgi:3-oxoacyl-[acyl-carrier-protein] synthase-1
MTANGGAVITGLGMTTPVGLTAAQSCAAVRAGISAMAELDFSVEIDLVNHVPVAGCGIPVVTEGYVGLGRSMRLATAALRDLISSARLSAADLRSASLFLAVPPATRGGVDSRIPQLLGRRIAQSVGAPHLEARTYTYAEGHAAGARALQDALAQVAAGAIELGIVCGVDSLVERETLEFLLAKRRLKTADQVDGLVPGEAGACLLLERASRARARGARALASIEAASTATETVTVWSDEPSPATGLSEAIRGTLDQLTDRGQTARVIVCDLNGESYRAREFGNAAARVLSTIPGPLAVWHPADCIGDTGAAAFAVSACVAARALANGYAKGDTVLLFGSSDDGLRGSAALRRIPAEA